MDSEENLIIAIYADGSYEIVNPRDVEQVAKAQNLKHILNGSKKQEYDLQSGLWKDLVFYVPYTMDMTKSTGII